MAAKTAAKKAAGKKAASKTARPGAFGTLPAIAQWSFSRWAVYEQCPFKAKVKFIDKRDEPSSPAMARGAEVHGLAQDFLEGRARRVAPELAAVADTLRAYKRLRATSEGEMGITRDWRPTGWFATDVWGRVKVDAMAETNKSGTRLDVVDWKTGKYAPDRPDYAQQLELYALGAFVHRPLVTEVRTRLIFTDHDQAAAPPVEEVFARERVDGLIGLWEGRLRAMLADRRFAPRVGAQCRSCPFRRAAGGPCRY